MKTTITYQDSNGTKYTGTLVNQLADGRQVVKVGKLYVIVKNGKLVSGPDYLQPKR